MMTRTLWNPPAPYPLRMPSIELTPAERDTALARIRDALQEDLAGSEDVTTFALVPDDAIGQVRIVSRESGVLAGSSVAQMVFHHLNAQVSYEEQHADGSRIEPGDVIAVVSGSMRSLLVGERTALNFLTMLSGTATLTRRFVDLCEGLPAQILDTRKTFPGLRDLQKYAVRCGGGENHRRGLYDAVLIKDNHLAWWQSTTQRSLQDAVLNVREHAGSGIVIEIEVDTPDQLRHVLSAAPDVVLLDNMSLEQLTEAVAVRNATCPHVLLEASGGVTPESVRGIALTGVDRISVGALTHSARALDIGFDWGQDPVN